MKTRVLLIGTNHPAVPTLQRLIDTGRCCGLIMPPSSEVGNRNDELMRIAARHNIHTSFSIDDVAVFNPDFILAANYPKLIPPRILAQYPCVNTHWSLLPRWRGVHGTAWALLNDDDHIGYTIHKMEGEFDTGDVLLQESILNTDDLGLMELHRRLSEMQAESVIKVIEKYEAEGKLTGRKQVHKNATYAPQRFPEDSMIDWTWPARRIFNLTRILPEPEYPGAFTFYKKRKLIILESKPAKCPAYWSTPGQVVRVIKGSGAWIKTGDTNLEVFKMRWEDEPEPVRADIALKRGMKLGRDLLTEIRDLTERIEYLEKLLSTVKKADE